MPRPAPRFPSTAALERALEEAAAPVPAADDVDAAVMVCLRAGGDGEEVLLCRRALRPGDPWSGQISLPGGRRDPDDRDALATALRETVEEVGFDPQRDGRVLGTLGVLRGRGRLVRSVRVACFVALLGRPVEPVVSDELAAAWWVPLASLVPARVAVPELPVLVPAYLAPADGEAPAVVWGMTHHMLTMLRRAASRPAGEGGIVAKGGGGADGADDGDG